MDTEWITVFEACRILGFVREGVRKAVLRGDLIGCCRIDANRRKPRLFVERQSVEHRRRLALGDPAAVFEEAARQLDAMVSPADHGCLEWQGMRDAAGYGRVFAAGLYFAAHRIAFQRRFGTIPPGFDVHHVCRNKPCCNSDHLLAVSRSEHCELDDALGVRYRRATTCVHGHPFDEVNTYRYTDRGRQRRACRICKATRNSARMREKTLAKTHCKHGHAFTPENTTLAQWNGTTRRYCRTCYRQPRTKP